MIPLDNLEAGLYAEIYCSELLGSHSVSIVFIKRVASSVN